jgi:hypothetical protein
MTDGLDVFVQLVMAAITTEPWPMSKRVLPSSTGTAVTSGVSSAERCLLLN